MTVFLTIILGVILQLFILKIFANNLAEELEKFENRIDEKLNLYDKLNQLKRSQEKWVNIP